MQHGLPNHLTDNPKGMAPKVLPDTKDTYFLKGQQSSLAGLVLAFKDAKWLSLLYCHQQSDSIIL